MAKILLLNPSKWGRGITPIWIPSHLAILKSHGHEVKLFDCTFYKDWMVNEIAFNTDNLQYKPSDYANYITLKTNDVFKDLMDCIKSFSPDLIFWSAISSHLHGEGEYVNIQYGHQLIKKLKTKAIKIAGGIQPTAKPLEMFKLFPKVDFFIRGESEFVLCELADNLKNKKKFLPTKGIIYRNNGKVFINPKQDIISDMDLIPPYDYSIFEDQVFYRPYNGRIVNAVDYELSRGCIYACSYCVETVIQKYYGFEKIKNGLLLNASNYLRCKSAKRVFEEFSALNKKYGVTLIRCQDSNFLTIKRQVLKDLAGLISRSDLDIKLYIETRPEGINPKTIKLLKKLKVDGVGTGIEVSTETFRKNSLNRYASQEKIIKAFKLLKESNIKRTAYNIIGLPKENEAMIIETIKFNQLINPDNITVAFYSPFIGTIEQIKSKDMNYFDDYEYNLDGALRSRSKSTLVSKRLLEFYKKYFVQLVIEGVDKIDQLKKKEGIK